MKSLVVCFAACVLFSVPLHAQQPAESGFSNPSPWTGSWKLDVARSSPVAAEAGVPHVYVLDFEPGGSPTVHFRWQIPEIGEVVKGITDGVPVPIQRTKPAPELRLGVRKDGPASLTYSVYDDGKQVGGGRMMLIDDGQAWVDVTWPSDHQDRASALVYVRK
ncbi:hypothetical protein [Occallatibacter savannae]|uniref:hypothetical protein n=1 Tax=Occallatibacter savannae TaxID=1002691 RepID=UPI000D69D6AC|nr:hypothetical protein [Occallatibacter savannae]